MSKKAYFRFYEELNDFLSSERKKVVFPYDFEGTPSVKDAVEAIGVPHTEVDLILVNGTSVPFAYHISDNDTVSVYPVFESLDISGVTHLREKPLREPKFILDVHLGKCAKYLRLLGFDSLYENTYDDPEIVAIAQAQKRAVLTRDVSLLKRKAVSRGYWVRSRAPAEQVIEVIHRFDLQSNIRPFSRCMACNGIVSSVTKDAVMNVLEQKTIRYYDEFYQCSSCGKVYWKGSHYTKMKHFIEDILKKTHQNDAPGRPVS